MTTSETKVLIHGLPHISRITAYWLNKHGLNAQIGGISSILKLKNFNIIHFIYSPTIKIRSLFLLPLLKLARKKIIVHWAGSDVLGLLTKRKMQILNKITKNFVDRHTADAYWLGKELAIMDVKSKVVPTVPNLKPSVLPLPNEQALLAYLPEKRYSFYGGDIVDKLADEFPEVKFLIVGNDGTKCKKKKNVEYLGYVPYYEMPNVYRKVRGLIRMPAHDGLSLMVVEALLHGRYVIYSKTLPHCFYARNFEEAKKYVIKIMEMNRPNYEGAIFAQHIISESVRKLLAVYRELLEE